MWNTINKVMLGVILLFLSVMDIRTKRICIWPLLLPAGSGLFYLFMQEENSYVTLLAVVVLFFALFGVSKATGGEIGAADAVAVGVMGIVVCIIPTIEILFLSVLGAALVGGGMLVFRRAGRKTTIPFYPFLTAAYIGVMVWHR
jgi:leader peptidase (prepilin peptidase) / N-methyltransferase